VSVLVVLALSVVFGSLIPLPDFDQTTRDDEA
jgi:hypothetical protein